MRWNGWGDPAEAAPLPDDVVRLLRDLLGVRPAAAPPVPMAGVRLPGPRLTAAARVALEAVVGAPHVRTDDEGRLRHTRGRSTPDLLRIRRGRPTGVPDAVVLPDGHDEVLAVLRVCAEHRVAVVPFGGGTSVVGGLGPQGPGCFVALDLRRMDRLLSVDPLSRTAVLEPGMRGPRVREALLPATASPSATSRSRSSGRASAASRRPAPAARRRPGTAASTTWSWR